MRIEIIGLLKENETDNLHKLEVKYNDKEYVVTLNVYGGAGVRVQEKDSDKTIDEDIEEIILECFQEKFDPSQLTLGKKFTKVEGYGWGEIITENGF
jgi:hypothetical protein